MSQSDEQGATSRRSGVWRRSPRWPIGLLAVQKYWKGSNRRSLRRLVVATVGLNRLTGSNLAFPEVLPEDARPYTEAAGFRWQWARTDFSERRWLATASSDEVRESRPSLNVPVEYSIVFDAEKEDVFVQGGDLMVLDEQTLILGVGSLSEPLAAERLAQVLDIDVLAVSMPPANPRRSGYDGWTGVHGQFLYLDAEDCVLPREGVLLARRQWLQGEPHRL